MNIFGSFYRFNKDDLSPAVIFEKSIASPIAKICIQKRVVIRSIFLTLLVQQEKINRSAKRPQIGYKSSLGVVMALPPGKK
ncbi:hypothetical protein BCY89_17390 [Sphingobacterium siyangense]|uniref:Uncharacterized protein n=1 Tax=Sphingobacterium siyangense TaxID=459529 RepID=A0A420FG05_9SPHI|nr:hypothetical protein BCY89_17390 [Sphingobacterium siyangense]